MNEEEKETIKYFYNLRATIDESNMLFDEDINEFVKARNNVTHNGLISLDNKVVNTAFVLMALTYVCTLERMGMETKYIEDIMGKRLFR